MSFARWAVCDMSDIETAVQASRLIENLLELRLGASGRGLHEKITSVEHRLPEHIVKRARFVASVRNGVVHDPTKFISDREGFENAVEDVTTYLRDQKIDTAGGKHARSAAKPAVRRSRGRPHRSFADRFRLAVLVGVLILAGVAYLLEWSP